MDFRQLLPEPDVVSVEALLEGLQPGEHAPPYRPYTAVNFVASADGHVTFDGRSGALGDDGDRAMFHGLREQVDAVLAGTRTLTTERYGRLVTEPERRRRRVERGLEPEPIACIITRSGQVPQDIPLFGAPEARVVVFTPSPIRRPSWRAQVEQVRLDPGEPSIVTALHHMREELGVRSLLCEGGPTIFGAMLQEQVVDELFLTLAPKLAGGGFGPAVSTGAQLAHPRPMRIRWALERDGALYLRYGLW